MPKQLINGREIVPSAKDGTEVLTKGGKTMAFWNEPIMENGVEVHYSSSCELYRLTDPITGEYDAKIDVYPNHIEFYSSKDSYWDEHIHTHTDSKGNTTAVHPMEQRDWETTCRG